MQNYQNVALDTKKPSLQTIRDIYIQDTNLGFCHLNPFYCSLYYTKKMKRENWYTQNDF